MDQIIALEELDISIKKGSFTVIIGPTGSGKSSLLSSMLGELLYLPKDTINEVGDRQRKMKDGELRYLEDAVLTKDLRGINPVTLIGSTGFCEQ